MSDRDRILIFAASIAVLIMVLGRSRPNLAHTPVLVVEYLGYNSPPRLTDPLTKPVLQPVGVKN